MTASKIPCCTELGSFFALLQQACLCGRVTFKAHKRPSPDDQLTTKKIVNIPLHNLKDAAMHSLFGGTFQFVLTGDVTMEHSEKPSQTVSAFRRATHMN